jgi:hypothetical protein
MKNIPFMPAQVFGFEKIIPLAIYSQGQGALYNKHQSP